MDPREVRISEETRLILNGFPPTAFNWPGTPWYWLLALSARLRETNDPQPIIFFGRTLVILFSGVSLGLFASLARKLVSRRAGLAAICLLAASPGFSSGEASLALVDMGAFTFGMLGVRLASAHALRFSTFSGVCVGIAGTFKLPSLLSGIPAACLVTFPGESWKGRARKFSLLCIGTMMGFLLGCPYLLQDLFSPEWNAVFDDLNYEMEHYRQGHYGLVPTADDTLMTRLARHYGQFSWTAGFIGAVAYSAVGLGGLWLAVKRFLPSSNDTNADAMPQPIPILLLWGGTVVAMLLAHRITFSRHWVVLLPPTILLTLAVIEKIQCARYRRVVLGVVLLGGIHALLMTVIITQTFHAPSTITQAEKWLAERPSLTVSVGPETPIFQWLYPSSALAPQYPSDLGEADAFLVTAPEAELQRRIAESPEAYAEWDFFPLTRSEFVTGGFFRQLETSAEYMKAATFSAEIPDWARTAIFFHQPFPFPLNSLAHPEIRVYVRRNLAASLEASYYRTKHEASSTIGKPLQLSYRTRRF